VAGALNWLFSDAVIFLSIVPSRPFYNKSSSYRVGQGFEPPETIVDKSALNCGQGLRPETAYFKALLPFKSSLYRIGQGLEHPRLLPKSPHSIVARF
jgi:hypothetical protein